jgi:hypothetical protein
MATSTGPGTDLAPSTPGAVAPLPAGGAPTPAAPGTDLAQPAAGNAVSREFARPAGGNVALNLAAHSWLDEILKEMALLNGELQILNDGLATLRASSAALDAIITNMDELGKLFEAPATTRSALDADSTVAAAIDNMVDQAQRHGHNAQVLNAQGFLGLQTVAKVQDNERAMGAGPRLLASAGRL